MTKQFSDGEIIGVDADGTLIQWDADKQEPYNCGENLEDFTRDGSTLTENEINIINKPQLA
jgi:hypothetical protein